MPMQQFCCHTINPCYVHVMNVAHVSKANRMTVWVLATDWYSSSYPFAAAAPSATPPADDDVMSIQVLCLERYLAHSVARLL